MEIHIFENELNGRIPTELGLLTSITELRLDNAPLIGTIPTQLGQLIYLTNLQMGYNPLLTGPLDIFTELGNLALLQDLQLQCANCDKLDVAGVVNHGKTLKILQVIN